MTKYNIRKILIICLFLGCVFVPLSSKADGNLYRGKHLYFKKCMSCHNQQMKLVYPDMHTRMKWELLLNNKEKDNICSRYIKELSKADKADILLYLQHNAYDSGKRVRCDD